MVVHKVFRSLCLLSMAVCVAFVAFNSIVYKTLNSYLGLVFLVVGLALVCYVKVGRGVFGHASK